MANFDRIKVTPVEAIVHGDNSDLVAAVAKLHVMPADKIADLTFGKGVFWKRTRGLNVTGSDIMTVPERPYDMRATPYANNQFDIAVIDPPYIHSPGNHTADHRYQNAATTKGYLQADIRQLYVAGMREGMRIAKRQVWVKCKDQVQSGMQRWSHCELLAEALAMGLFARDLFMLLPTSRTPAGRWSVQHHARRPYSFLWVFEKPTPSIASQMKREKIDTALHPTL